MVLFIYLLLVIAFIVVGTAKFKLHPFLVLLLAALVMGGVGGLDGNAILTKLTEGFGGTLKSIGIVIACGTIIGVFLERSGGARAIAGALLKVVGESKAPMAMSLTGVIVSVPVFCDSGFVILSTLIRALSRKTGMSLAVLAVALATGLYATHVFVPPTPGPLAAAATLGADIGLIVLYGLLVSIPTAGVGLVWALWYAKRFAIVPKRDTAENPPDTGRTPGTAFALAPLLVPVVLIALKSVADSPAAPFGEGWLSASIKFLGHPVMALMIGVFFAFGLPGRERSPLRFEWVTEGLRQAGVIILITGAGGAFGNVLRAIGIGDALGPLVAEWNLGILLPFVVAALLKSAQGSSTVAIITTAALVAPLLPDLGLTSATSKALAVLAIGAGSMTVSHVNDSYFWVVSQFSEMDTATALRCHTLATLWQGMTGILVIALLNSILG